MKVEILYSNGTKEVMANVVSCRPMEEDMDFSEAVKLVKMNNKVRRLSWPEGDYLFNDFKHDHLMKHTVDPTGFCGLTIEDVEATDWWLMTD